MKLKLNKLETSFGHKCESMKPIALHELQLNKLEMMLDIVRKYSAQIIAPAYAEGVVSLCQHDKDGSALSMVLCG